MTMKWPNKQMLNIFKCQYSAQAFDNLKIHEEENRTVSLGQYLD